MKRLLLCAAGSLFLSGSVWWPQPSEALAQLPDHLQCHRVRDTEQFTGAVLDLAATQAAFQLPDHCVIRVGRAVKLCVPVQKMVVHPGSAQVPPIQPPTQELVNDYVCYKMKCPEPEPSIPDTKVTDQFGSRHLVRIKGAQEICVPAIKGVPTTTTTLTTTTSTSTTTTLSGEFIGSTGCKEWPAAMDGNGTPPDQDCIEYSYSEGEVLALSHINTAFNCCPEFEADISVVGGKIVVGEREISGLCNCLCLFDLDYRVLDLDPGVYVVSVSQEYLREGDEPLEFTIDLLASPSGSHCVQRDHYPWGIF